MKCPRRRKRPALRKPQTKKQRPRQAVVERSLSDINYDHWWRNHPCWNEATALSLDEQKAAVFYEAYRRCPILQDAWLKGTRGPQAMINFGWQMFTATVLNHLPQTWVRLPLGLRKGITINQLPEMLPPVGYSVWPAQPFSHDLEAKPPKADSETRKEYEERWRPESLEQYHQRCRNLAAKIITIPCAQQNDALDFLKQINRLADDGFVLVAIDNKSREAFSYAIQFLEQRLKRRRSYRHADIYWCWPERADAMACGEEPAGVGVIQAETRVIGKRIRKSKDRQVTLESNIFKFQELCKGLESYDKTGTPSDLMKRLRSGYKKETH